MMFSLEWRARMPGSCVFRFVLWRFFLGAFSRCPDWHRDIDCHENDLQSITGSLFQPPPTIECWSFLCARFVKSICREKCRMYWVMISIKFGAVLTRGMAARAEMHAPESNSDGWADNKTRKREAKAFIDITLEPLFFSFIFLLEWQIWMMQKMGRWENRITHLPTHVLLRRWAIAAYDGWHARLSGKDVGGKWEPARDRSSNWIKVQASFCYRFNRKPI